MSTATAKNLAGSAPPAYDLRRAGNCDEVVVGGWRIACSCGIRPAQGAPLDGAYRAVTIRAAINAIGPAAERGDPRAQAYLGFMYQYGRGVRAELCARRLLVPARAEQATRPRSICSA
jgi:TPR repeat protein